MQGKKIALSLAQQITDLSQRELVTQLSTIGGEVQQNTVSIPNLSANEWGKQLFQQRQVIYSETERQALIFFAHLFRNRRTIGVSLPKFFRRFERHYFSGYQKSTTPTSN